MGGFIDLGAFSGILALMLWQESQEIVPAFPQDGRQRMPSTLTTAGMLNCCDSGKKAEQAQKIEHARRMFCVK